MVWTKDYHLHLVKWASFVQYILMWNLMYQSFSQKEGGGRYRDVDNKQ